MKGKSDGSSSIEFAIAELYGGIRQQIIFFAAEVGTSAGWVAERISTLLSPERSGVQHNVPTMQFETTGGRGTVEQVEMVVHAHRGQTPVAIEAERGGSEASNGSQVVKRQNPKMAAYWAKMTPQERATEQVRRLSKIKNKTARIKKMIKSLKLIADGVDPIEVRRNSNRERLRKQREKKRAPVTAEEKVGRNGHRYPVQTPEEKQAKMIRYHERHVAKRAGLPVPPLL